MRSAALLRCAPPARLFAVLLLLGVGAPAVAQTTYTWNNPASGQDWLTAGNWAPAGPPNAASTTAVFGGVSTGANAVSVSSGVMIGQLSFTDVNQNSATAAYTVGSAGTIIAFSNGTSANQLTVGGFTRTNQTVSSPLTVATAQPLSITNDGALGLNTLTLSGNLTGAGSTALNVGGQGDTTIGGTINGGFGVLTKSGPGVLTLTGTNAYTGGTVITGGAVSVTSDAQLGAAAGGVTLNGGALRITDTGFTSSRNFTIGANGGLIDSRAGGGSANPTLNGVISGSSTLTFDGGGYVFLGGANTFSGAVVLRNAGVNLTGSGTLTNASSITINGGLGGNIGILTLDNSFSSSNTRVSASAPITLSGGLLSLTGNLLGSVSQSFGNVQVNGYGLIYGAPAGSFGGTTTMTFGTLTRSDNFTTLYVGGAVGGAASNSSVQITFSSMTPSSGSGQEMEVIPWIGGDRSQSNPTGIAETLFVYDSHGLRALDTTNSNDFAQVAAGDPLSDGFNVLNTSITGNPQAMAGDLTIKSLVLNAGGTGSSTISGTGKLTIESGAIANIRALTFNGPQLDFGSNTGYLYLGANLTISGASFITGTNGLVVSSNSNTGSNSLQLGNTLNANTFSGGLYINGTARVIFTASDAQLGAPGEVIAFRGGVLRYSGSSSITLATAGINRPLRLDTAGGAIDVGSASATLTVPGLVSGTDGLTKLGSGTLVLANTANTYQGGTTLSAGTLTAAAVGSLGSGAVRLEAGTLQFNGGGTLSAPVTVAGAVTVNTNGNNVSFTGAVDGNGTTLTKAGGGTLTLTGNNTFSANTMVSGGRLAVNNTVGSGTGFGAVSVASGATLAGTGTVYGPVTVASGGTLAPGDTLGKLTLRSGATLASGSTFAVALNGNAAGTGFSQLVLAAGSSLSLGGATFSPTLGYVPASTDKLFVVDNQNPTGGLTSTFAGLTVDGAMYTFADGTKAQISYTGDIGSGNLSGGNDVVLYNFQPIPEPGLVLLASAAALAAGGLWRRRQSGLDALRG